MLGHLSPVSLSHFLLQNAVGAGEIAVDATVGNGHDTRFLCQLVGATGQVFGFDIQQCAIANTQQWFEEHPEILSPTLYHVGHEHMHECLPQAIRGQIKAFIFNLGYLPGGDKQLITRADTTLSALETALEWLCPAGILVIVVYRGHDGGDAESQALLQWTSQIPTNVAETLRMERQNLSAAAPYILLVRKTQLPISR
jgi:predicted methyltransferase